MGEINYGTKNVMGKTHEIHKTENEEKESCF